MILLTPDSGQPIISCYGIEGLLGEKNIPKYERCDFAVIDREYVFF
jgi:hypothetical protein